MSATTGVRESALGTSTPSSASHDGAPDPGARWTDPRYQAFALLRVAFTVAPIAFGLDKFFNVLVDWPIYLAPWINDISDSCLAP